MKIALVVCLGIAAICTVLKWVISAIIANKERNEKASEAVQ